MTALRAHHRGGPDVPTVERAPVPVPAVLLDNAESHVSTTATFPLDRGRQAFEIRGQPHRRPGKTTLTIRD